MRPIELTVKGLHSFREKQTIDFKTLCAVGVFGIFGPTGSGKSSLLDAVTLALYGKVERAVNNTQGILNHAEETLAVSFTFELGYQGAARRYKVERSLKRTGDIHLRTVICRFLDVTGDPLVLADKAGEVNRNVEDLLGLSHEDFTRAVVLPQGKFAEFLSLKGSERRHMLQRLFHLEKYGDELNKKLKDRLQNTQQEQEQIEAEQAGLGDASREAVNRAKQRLQELEVALTLAIKELQASEKRHEQEKQLREWQQDKEKAEHQLQELEKKKEDILQLEKTLHLSQQAERLLPYAQELEESKRSLSHWQKEKQESIDQLEEAQKAEQIARNNYELARRQKSEEEPLLQIRLDRLKQTKESVEKLHQAKKDLQDLQAKQAKLEADRQQAEEKFNQAAKDRDKYQQAQDDLHKQLAELEIPSTAKNKIYQAYEAKQRIKNDETRLHEEQQELQATQKAYRTHQADLQKKQEAYTRSQEQGKQRLLRVYSWYEHLAADERELNTFRKMLREARERQHKKLETEKATRLAHRLAQHLEEGQPCPVCGSTDHPDPTRETGRETDPEQAVRELERWEERITAAHRETEQVKWQLEQLSAQLEETAATRQPVTTQPVRTEAELPRRFPFLTVPNWEEQADHVLQLMAQERGEMNNLDQLVRRDQQQLSQAREELKEAEIILNNSTTDLNTRQEKVARLTTHIKDAKTEWYKMYPQLSYDNIENEQHKVRQQDEEAAEIRKRIKKSIPHIEKKDKEVQKLNESINQLKVDAAATNTEIHQKSQMVTDMEKSVQDILAGQEVNVLLQHTEARLQDLRRQEEHTLKTFNQTVNTLQKSESRTAVAQQSWQDAEKRYHQAQTRWDEHKRDTPFGETATVQEARLDPETEQVHRRTIETYSEQSKQLRQRIQEREEQLAGRYISADHWKETVANFEEIRHKVDVLREERGGAANVLQDLQDKHKRYQELNLKKVKLQKLLDRYQKLDHVLRGKAFVEFIAEEQLIQVSRTASERLHTLTRGRYAIEVDSSGGFVIRDDVNGGVKRPVSTLSGGETFLTSLALALSLSASIQLRGEHPLEFFFLDEGFGTLDQELLETVVSALEKLPTDRLSVGVISHVPELKERLPRKLMVTRAEPGGQGSSVRLESM